MYLFDNTMPVYKGNLHLHTTRSDGRLAPEDAISLYQTMGYDFLAVTDHWTGGIEGFHKNMLLLGGTELDFYLPNQVLHMVCLGLKETSIAALSRNNTPQEAIDATTGDGGLVILAHPAWSLNTPDVIAELNGVTAAEIYNTVSGMPWNGDRADASNLLDIVASNGRTMNFVASDDAHFYNGDQCRAFIMVQAASLTRDAVYEALKAGRFYASQGPRFEEIELIDDALRVVCSPVERILFYSNLPYVANRCRTGSDMRRAIYERVVHANSRDRYVRCQIIDKDGNSAWSNPIVFVE